MRDLPIAHTLSEAVRNVIHSNCEDGYVPSRFIQVTEGGRARGLVEVCSRIITSPDALSAMTEKLREMHTLLAIEDYVSRYGAEWGFDPQTISESGERSVAFDELVGAKRYR